jgi:hypothetical protein
MTSAPPPVAPPVPPFPLAQDAPRRPPVVVRALEPLPFLLVRRTHAQLERDALEAFARATAAYRLEGPGSLDDHGEPDDPRGEG